MRKWKGIESYQDARLISGTHLLPIFGDRSVPHNFHYSYTLDAFHSYFVNKYIDHASHEMVF